MEKGSKLTPTIRQPLKIFQILVTTISLQIWKKKSAEINSSFTLFFTSFRKFNSVEVDKKFFKRHRLVKELTKKSSFHKNLAT